MNLHATILHIEGKVRRVQEVISEVFLGEVIFVSPADDKVVDTVCKIALQVWRGYVLWSSGIPNYLEDIESALIVILFGAFGLCPILTFYMDINK